MLAINTEYKPLTDYKPQQIKFIDKVTIPQIENSEVNFAGLLLGPRRNILKTLEKRDKCQNYYQRKFQHKI